MSPTRVPVLWGVSQWEAAGDAWHVKSLMQKS